MVQMMRDGGGSGGDGSSEDDRPGQFYVNVTQTGVV